MTQSKIADQLENVTLKLKANIYFDGGVVSHTVVSKAGPRQTVGLIHAGSYHFTTEAPERMDVIAGACRVKQSGESGWKTYNGGDGFNVPGNSAFDIAVDSGIAEYLCTFG